MTDPVNFVCIAPQNLSQLHQKARHRFQTTDGGLVGGPGRLDRDEVGEPDLEVDERERERQDIIERIMQLEVG